MKCPKCNSNIKEVEVEVEGAKQKVISYQCTKCDYVDFEKESAFIVVNELKLI